MGWWARLFGGGYEALWLAERAAAEEADMALEARMDPEAYRMIEWRYRLPDGRWGEMRVHRCGPARLKRELAARGSTGSQGAFGHVLGGQVDMYVLAGPAPTGRLAGSQRGRGHEQSHIEDQIAAALEAWEAAPGGAPWPQVQAAGDRHTYDADHSGEGL